MLRLIVGSAISDVSGEVVREMVSQATANGSDKYIIIVPEQFTLQTQKQVVKLHPRHACMNIDVVSFDRLAHVVLSKLGKDITEVLDDVGKALILRRVLENVSAELKVYGSKIRMAGFVEEVKSLITEFKQYGIDDNTLYMMEEQALEQGSLLAAKLQDIRLIYSKFNESIADKYTTAEEVLDVFARALPDSDFLKGSHIYLEGFTGFTPIQYRLLERMLNSADDVVCSIVMPVDAVSEQCPDYGLFKLANDTYFRLKEIAGNAGAGFEVVKCPDVRKVPDVNIVSCTNPEGEAEFIAGRILRLVKEEGLRFRDIAVLTSDMEEYHAQMDTVMRNAGIPAFIDYKTEFESNQLVRFMLAALEVSAKGLTYDNVFSFMKTGLTGTDSDDLSLLENYCLEFNIKVRNKWENDFSANREMRDGTYAWDLEKINTVKKRVSPLVTFFGRTGSGQRNVHLLCKLLKNLMNDYGVSDTVTKKAAVYEAEGNLALSKQYQQIYEKVCDLIDKVDRLMGSEKMTAREFSEIMSSGVQEIKIGTIPPSVDSLTIGDLTRTRLGNVRYTFVAGVNDGKIPAAGSGSALFTQKEREFLRKDYEIAPTALENIFNQRYYLYLAFNKPENSVILTYAGTNSAGEQLGPSCVLEDIEELMASGCKITRSNSGQEFLWKNKAVSMLAGRIRNLEDDNDISKDDLIGYFASKEPETLRRLIRGASFTNIQSNLDKRVALDLYGEVLKGSVSRYETFYMCPYRHFLGYGLRLEKRREYQVQATDLGTIYHDALEKYSKKIADEGFSFRSINDEDSHRITKSCVSEAIDGIGNDILSGSARNEHLKNRIEEITSRTTDVLREHVRAGLFEPEAFELSFDEKISDGVMFKGKIDRVDIYDGGDLFIKIIDYKSGGKKFSVRDIYSGIQLQLVAYMNSAVKEMGRKFPGRNIVPGGVYYYLVNDKYVKAEDIADKNTMSGLTLADDDVIHAIDSNVGSPDHMSSKIVKVGYTKSGALSKNSIVADGEEFAHLIGFVNTQIEKAGEMIRSGDISLHPYKGDNSHNGCSFCDYKDICKFEAGSFGSDWRECEGSDEEIKEVVYGRNKVD